MMLRHLTVNARMYCDECILKNDIHFYLLINKKKTMREYGEFGLEHFILLCGKITDEELTGYKISLFCAQCKYRSKNMTYIMECTH